MKRPPHHNMKWAREEAGSAQHEWKRDTNHRQKKVSKNVFPGTQSLSFPLTKVMYVLDIEYGMLVQAYFLPSDPQRGLGRTHG